MIVAGAGCYHYKKGKTMKSLIQDYKNYRTAKKTLAKLETDVRAKINQMLVIIDKKTFNNYLARTRVFIKTAKEIQEQNDQEKLKQLVDLCAPLVNAPSCFFTVSLLAGIKPHDIVEEIILDRCAHEERKLQEKHILRCMHNHEDGNITENYCINCPREKFQQLVEYQSLNSQFQNAQKGVADARQKLLNNFAFIKQK